MQSGHGEVKRAGKRAPRRRLHGAGRAARGLPRRFPSRRHDRVSMNALFWLLNELITLYFWAVILAAVFSNLIAFNILDTRNRLVWTISDFLFRVTEPALRPIRSFLPNFGGIDISPIILVVLLQALRILLGEIQIALWHAGLY